MTFTAFEVHPFVFGSLHLNIFPTAPDRKEWQIQEGTCHVGTRQHHELFSHQNLVRQMFTRLARNFGGATSFCAAKCQTLGGNLGQKYYRYKKETGLRLSSTSLRSLVVISHRSRQCFSARSDRSSAFMHVSSLTAVGKCSFHFNLSTVGKLLGRWGSCCRRSFPSRCCAPSSRS